MPCVGVRGESSALLPRRGVCGRVDRSASLICGSSQTPFPLVESLESLDGCSLSGISICSSPDRSSAVPSHLGRCGVRAARRASLSLNSSGGPGCTRSISLLSSSTESSGLHVRAVDASSVDGPVDPAEARRRCRDIREGKHPIQEIPCNKSASLAFSVSPSSSIVPQGDCSTPLSPCFRPLSLRQPTDPSLTSGPSFINGFRPIMPAEPTPLVFPLPYVHPMQAGLNRMKRKFLWRHRSGKTKVKKLAPPFSKNHIDLLKATVRGRSYYGGPEYICGACHALYWFQERSKGAHDGRFNLPVYNGGCCGGKVSLPKFPDWPFPLKDLVRFDGDDTSSRFLRLIRHYNSMFCFTSLGAHVDESVNMGSGPYVFKMGGSVYHRIGSLMPVDNEAPKFAQLYIVDSADELNCRLDVFKEQGGAPSQADPLLYWH